jgi:hypothetical protein
MILRLFITTWLVLSGTTLWAAAAIDSSSAAAQIRMVAPSIIPGSNPSLLSDPRQIVALMLGVSACLFTSQRMWQNLRKS